MAQTLALALQVKVLLPFVLALTCGCLDVAPGLLSVEGEAPVLIFWLSVLVVDFLCKVYCLVKRQCNDEFLAASMNHITHTDDNGTWTTYHQRASRYVRGHRCLLGQPSFKIRQGRLGVSVMTQGCVEVRNLIRAEK